MANRIPRTDAEVKEQIEEVRNKFMLLDGDPKAQKEMLEEEYLSDLTNLITFLKEEESYPAKECYAQMKEACLMICRQTVSLAQRFNAYDNESQMNIEYLARIGKNHIRKEISRLYGVRFRKKRRNP